MELRAQAIGCWPYIHRALGIDQGYLRNQHMPCPGCGGTDRFRYDDKEGRGTFFCGGGGDPVCGDGFELLRHVNGWDFKQCADQVRRVLGIDALKRKPLIVPKVRIVPAAPQSSKTKPYALSLRASASDDSKYVSEHPYCQRKGITSACGASRGPVTGKLVGQRSDCVIVPQRTIDGVLVGVECINSGGVKQSFGNKGLLVLGNDLDDALPQLIVEGWATAVSVLNIYDWNACVYACFGKGMMKNLAIQVAMRYPQRQIIIGDEQDG